MFFVFCLGYANLVNFCQYERNFVGTLLCSSAKINPILAICANQSPGRPQVVPTFATFHFPIA